MRWSAPPEPSPWTEVARRLGAVALVLLAAWFLGEAVAILLP